VARRAARRIPRSPSQTAAPEHPLHSSRLCPAAATAATGPVSGRRAVATSPPGPIPPAGPARPGPARPGPFREPAHDLVHLVPGRSCSLCAPLFLPAPIPPPRLSRQATLTGAGAARRGQRVYMTAQPQPPLLFLMYALCLLILLFTLRVAATDP
jgi:hypothetical protein